VSADSYGVFAGTYEASAQAGVPGPRAPEFPGFSSTNTALGSRADISNSAVRLPPLYLNSNTATLLGWIYPNGPQSPYAGIVFSRAGSTVAGLNYSGDGTTLGYTWNGSHSDWDSGLIIPANDWSLAALVITPTNAILYVGSGRELVFRANIANHSVEGFNGESFIGRDNSGGGARIFGGSIDDVAVFNRSLSLLEIQAIYSASNTKVAMIGTMTAALITIPVGLPSVAVGMFMHAAHPGMQPILALPM